MGGGAGTAPTGTTHSLLPDIFKFGASRRGKHRLHLHIALLGKQKPKNELGLALNHSTRLGGRGGMGCKPAQGPPTCPFPAPSAFASQWSVCERLRDCGWGVCSKPHKHQHSVGQTLAWRDLWINKQPCPFPLSSFIHEF